MIRALALTLSLATCLLAAPALAQETPSDWRALDPANTLVIDSSKGRIVVELRPDIAPGHVQRIKTLTRQGYYTGSLFYRVLPFMAQTGDKGDKTYRSPLPNLKNEAVFRIAPGAPYWSFASSAAGDLGFLGPMPVLVAPDGRAHVLYCPGVTAFAHGDSPDSANSQIFLMRTLASNLEGSFTAFGRVVQGQDVVAAIKNGEPPPNPDKMVRVRIMADMPAADRPTVQVIDTRGAAFAAQVQATFKDKAANFTLCDVAIPTR